MTTVESYLPHVCLLLAAYNLVLQEENRGQVKLTQQL